MRYEKLFPIPLEWIQDIDESLAETVAGWAEREVASRRLEFREDLEGLLIPAMKRLFVDIGLQNTLWPTELGGGGLTSAEASMTAAAVLEQVSAGDTGIAFLHANTMVLQSAFGVGPNRDERLLEEFAPVFCGDEIGIASLVLPAYGSGSNGEAPRRGGLDYQVTASREGDLWLLGGDGVRPQCSGAMARLFGVVFAAEEGEPALALVPSDATGLTVGEVFKKTGLAASVNADLRFEGVEVPEGHVVSRGRESVQELLSRYYGACAAVCTGALFASYEIIKEWVNTRVIKGKGQVFKENPLVAALLGEIGGAICTSRLLTYDLARLLSRPDIYGPAGSGLVFATATAVFKQVSRAAMRALDNTMELMASAGYSTEWNLERYWRDVKTVESYVMPETAALVDAARHYFALQSI